MEELEVGELYNIHYNMFYIKSTYDNEEVLLPVVIDNDELFMYIGEECFGSRDVRYFCFLQGDKIYYVLETNFYYIDKWVYDER